MAHDTLRELPAVSRLLAHPRTERLLVRFNREYVVQACRDLLDELRRTIGQGHALDTETVNVESIVARLESRLFDTGNPGLQRVVNATGTVLHTNLGRALLAQSASDAVLRAATQPVNLEYDLVQGERGRREQAIEDLVKHLTGAEAATVVNNNAAAVLLVLNTLASGREVIVSRGELVEIGGAFRIPEIMARSGVVLREVGTTNRTHPSDYEEAISDRTALLLRVHTSNYKIVGFVAEVGLPELVAIGARRGIPVMEDLGSGAFVDLSRYGLPKEPVVAERIALGTDIVTFSGDKVLGGPQAGIIAGKTAWLQQIGTKSPAPGAAVRKTHDRGARCHAAPVSRVGVHHAGYPHAQGLHTTARRGRGNGTARSAAADVGSRTGLPPVGPGLDVSDGQRRAAH